MGGGVKRVGNIEFLLSERRYSIEKTTFVKGKYEALTVQYLVARTCFNVIFGRARNDEVSARIKVYH